MNAPAKPSHFASPFGEPVTGELLCRDFQMTDTLQIVLWGELPDFDDGYTVTGISLPSDPNRTNIVDMFSGRQLEKMGEWLDFKDDVNPTLRRVAMNAKHEAMPIKF